MPTRRLSALITLGLLAGVLGASLWLQSPGGRGWVVAQLADSLATSGYRLGAQESAGRPWRDLALFDVEVEGPGVSARAERIDLAYRLGGLLRGRLPLELRVSGLRGDLSLDDLEALRAPSGGGWGPALELRRLEVEDVALRVGGVPYSLPDLEVADLEITEREGGLRLAGRLATAHGGARLRGEFDRVPLELRLEVVAADARLARTFWEGVEAGTVSGRVTLLSGPPRGAFTLEDGAASLAGLALEAVSGRVDYRHPVLTGTLAGRTLDGPARATGEVDVEARRWQAEVRGEPALAATAAWLTEGARLPLGTDWLGLGGEAEARLTAAGWQSFALEGEARGRGRALGQRLEALEASFGYRSGLGTRVTALASLEEGEVAFALEPEEGGFQGRLEAAGLALDGLALDGLALGGEAVHLSADLEATFENLGEGLRAGATLAGAGEAAGEALELRAEASLEGGRWTIGTAGLYAGRPLEATGTVDGGDLRARAHLPLPPLYWLEGAGAAVLVLEGPVEEARWSLELAGDAPLRPAWGGARLDADLRGALAGTLSAAGVSVDEGALGPLELRGHYDPFARSGEFRYAVAGAPLTGSAAGELAHLQGTVAFAGDVAEARGELRAEAVEVGPARLASITAALEGRYTEAGLALELRAENGLRLAYGPNGLEADLSGYALEVAGTPWTLEGEVRGEGDARTVALRATAPGAALEVAGSAARAVTSLHASPGYAWGPLELARSVSLAGELRLAAGTLELTGAAGDLPLHLAAAWGAPEPSARLTLMSGSERLELAAAGEGFILEGEVPLAAIGDLVGVEVGGRIRSDLARQEGAYRGSLELTVDPRFPAGSGETAEPLQLSLMGAGDEVRLSGAGNLLGIELVLQGRLLPALEAELALGGLGLVSLRREGGDLVLAGGGRVEAAAAGLRLDEPWRLEGSLNAAQARLWLGASQARLGWDAAGWELEALLEQSARLLGTEAALRATLRASAGRPDGQVEGHLELAHPDAPAGTLRLAGTLREPTLAGTLPAALVGAVSGLAEGAEALELEARADLLAGPRYSLAARGPGGLQASLRGEGGRWRAEAAGDGLEAWLERQAGAAGEPQTRGSLLLDAFAPARLLAVPADLSLSGRLEGGPAGYAGELAGTLTGTPAFRLWGEGEALLLDATAEVAGTRLEARGRLLPAPDLELGAVSPELGEVVGRVEGEAATPELRASLRLYEQEAGGFRLPPLELPLEGAWGAGGLTLRLGEARFAEGAWTGRLGLPLELAGRVHRVEGPVGGSLAVPQWDAALEGPFAQGRVLASREGASARLSLDAADWLAELGVAGLVHGRLEAAAELAPSARWSLSATGEGEAASLPGTTLRLEASVRGEGRGYEGEGTVTAGAQPLALSFGGEGADLRGALTLASFDLGALALPAGILGSARGRLDFRHTAAEGLRYDADLEAAGEGGGQPFALSLRGDERALSLDGRVAELAVRAEGSAAAFAARAEGDWEGAPVLLEASYEGGEGSWQGRYGDLVAAGELKAAAEGVRLTGASRLAALPGLDEARFDFAARLGAGRLLLERSALEGGGATAFLSGELWPEADLEGRVTAAPLAAPLELELTGTAGAGYRVTLRQPGASAELRLNPDFTPHTASLRGLPALTGTLAPLSGDVALDWSEGAGFSGEAALALALGPGLARVALEGGGDLRVTAHWEVGSETGGEAGGEVGGEAPLALELALGPRPWEARELRGTMSVRGLGSSPLLPVNTGMQLWGELAVSGNLLEPLAAGPLRLEGREGNPVATGWASLSPTEGRLELAGRHLNLRANAGGATRARGAWDLSAQAASLDVTSLLPGLRASALSGRLRASGGGDAGLVAEGSYTLAAPGSRIAGTFARGESGLEGVADVYLNLSDLALDPALSDLISNNPPSSDLPSSDSPSSGGGDGFLQGLLRGPLSLEDGRLRGELRLDGLSAAGAAWALGGSLGLGGSLDDPQLELALSGRGEARGSLRARLRPLTPLLELSSTLTVADFGSEIELALDSRRLEAGGNVAWRDFVATLGVAERVLLVEGAGALEGWRATVTEGSTEEAHELTLAGPLSGLHAAASGQLELAARWPDPREEDEGWLSGRLHNASLAGFALGDLSLHAEGRGAELRLRLEGEGLLAELAAGRSGPRWRLERLEAAGPSGLNLEATGAGGAEGGLVEATLAGGGERLPLEAAWNGSGLALSADGRLFGGAVTLAARHEDASGWSGGFALGGVTLAGHALSGEAALSGPLLAPVLQGTLAGTAPWGKASGDFLLSSARASLDAQVVPTHGRGLTLSGQLWPEVDLLATSGDERLRVSGGRAEGSLSLGWNGAALTLQPTGPRVADPRAAGLELVAHLGEAGPVLSAPLPPDLRELGRGLRFIGTEGTAGALSLSLDGGPRLDLEALAWAGGAGHLELNGALAWRGGSTGTGPTGTVTGTWTPAGDDAHGGAAWPGALGTLPLRLELEPGGLELSVGAHEDARVQGSVDWQDAVTARLNGRLAAAGGRLDLDLHYSETTGPSGEILIEGLPLRLHPDAAAHGFGSVRLSAEVELSPEGLRGDGRLEAAEGKLSLSGAAGWARLLPEGAAARWAPAASSDLQAVARLDAFNLANLPAVAAALPELDAPLTGVAQFVGDNVFGQLLGPELTVAGRRLAAELDFSGDWHRLEASVRLDRSRASLAYGEGRFSGLLHLESFPLQSLLEARFGPSEVTAAATGLARFDLPLGDLGAGDVRLASERLRIEHRGVVTEGEVALHLDETGLVLERAEFRGAGRWQAGGRLGPGGLDFSLTAEDADFGPLLALVPSLSALDVGLRGSLDLQLGGTAAAPRLSARSPGLEVAVGGSSYRLRDPALEVMDGRLAGRGRLEGAPPVGGALALEAEGQLELFPFSARDVSLSFAGSLELPPVGLVEDAQGRIVGTGEGWRLESSGRLGERFTLAGSLNPLDLRLTGRRLAVAAPPYYLLASETDLDLRLQDEDGFRLSGAVFSHSARLGVANAERAAGQGAVAAAPPGDTPLRDWVADERVVREPARNPLLERIHFGGVTIRAPQQVVFRESVGNAEMGVDLVLTGTAAEPLLQGQARLVRGLFRFSGRDFSVQQAEAAFAPAQGRYPVIRARAETSFDKSRVLAEEQGLVAFAAPRDTQSFKVMLDLYGEFVEVAPGVHRLRLEPTLSSDALIEDRRGAAGGEANGAGGPDLGVGRSPGVRPLQDEEILTLLTLGRLELGADVRGALRSDTALQTALDTAIDLYVLSELQHAFAEALGVDLFEIRTGALSRLIEGGESDFSVSVRVGAYLSDEVFASFSLGRFQYAPELYALGGSFHLRYDLSPLELSLSGGLSPRSGLTSRSLTPVPEFNLGISYSVTPLVNLAAGLDLTGGRDNAVGLRFGLDFRW